MKRIALLFALAAPLAALSQTTPAPKATATATPKTATTPAAKRPVAPAVKLPPGVPPVKGLVKIAFTTTLRYQDYLIGDGPVAEPGKVYHVLYTGWLASDGTKFDTTDDHRQPMRDKDGKPVMDADGKPKLGDPQPIVFPQGQGRLIPGWDQGFTGMKVGGKRRLFIPYHLAYGDLGRTPKIPPKSDLIFDVELVSVTDMPTRPASPGPGRPGSMPGAPGAPGAPGSNMRPPGSIQMLGPKPPTPAGTPTAPAPAAPSTAPAPATPATPPAAAPATPPATTPAPATPPPPAAAPATPPQPN